MVVKATPLIDYRAAMYPCAAASIGGAKWDPFLVRADFDCTIIFRFESLLLYVPSQSVPELIALLRIFIFKSLLRHVLSRSVPALTALPRFLIFESLLRHANS